MSFTASLPIPPNMPIIAADGFWPEIDPNRFRTVMRVDSSVTNERAREALVNAALDVMSDLSHFALENQSLGCSTLIDVASTRIDGRSRLISLFERAVFSFAKARLLEAYRDYDTARVAGSDRVEAKELGTDFYNRDGRFAINSILGISRISAELL